MRKPIGSSSFTQQVSNTTNWAAPVGGWRTDLAIADMPDGVAYQLDNWFPEANRIRVRYGSTAFSPDLGTEVQTLIPYSGTSNKLFAAANGAIYDITTGVPSAVVLGLTNDRWCYQDFSNAGSNFIRLVNGSDTPRLYNGTTWTATAITGPPSPNLLLAVTAYRSRLYFLEKGRTSIWYLDVNAVSGAATELDVGGNMKLGGKPVAIGTWTIPTATGLDQVLCVMTSEGELLTYQGASPSATDWKFIGSFKLGRPLGGFRCMMNVGGELAIMTTDGIIPISKAIQVDRGATNLSSLTKNIAPTWYETIQLVNNSSGQWQLLSYPKRKMAIVNIPNALGLYQYVMNTETGAWCRFVGMGSSCWAVWNDKLYFGGTDGKVYQADFGGTDDGNPIEAIMVGAWSTMRDAVSQKFSKLISATIQTDGATDIYGGVSVDYQVSLPDSLMDGTGDTVIAMWDVAIWGTSVFPGTVIKRVFASPGATGISFAPTIKAVVSSVDNNSPDTAIIGGSLIYEKGLPI